MRSTQEQLPWEPSAERKTNGLAPDLGKHCAYNRSVYLRCVAAL